MLQIIDREAGELSTRSALYEILFVQGKPGSQSGRTTTPHYATAMACSSQDWFRYFLICNNHSVVLGAPDGAYFVDHGG